MKIHFNFYIFLVIYKTQNMRSTNPQRRNNNPDDKIGVEIQVDDACVIYGGGGNAAAETMVPGNGEYAFSSIQGSCNYCINCMPKLMDGPAGCEGIFHNCASAGGGYPYYKRTSYRAPTYECCTTGSRTIGDKTCDPKYSGGPNTSECGPSMTRLCDPTSDVNRGSSDNLFSNPKCQAFCSLNKTNCESMYKNACSGDNLNSQRCKDKLIELGGSDTSVANWCNQGINMNDPFCSCFKALNAADEQTNGEVRSFLSRPECYTKQCSSGAGYKFTNMRNAQACPPVQNCINTLNIVGNTDLNLSQINQNCDQKMNSPPAVNSSSAPQSPQSQQSPNAILNKIKKAFSANPNLIYIILFIIILLCGLGIAIFTEDSEEIYKDANYS